eukprot:13440366-Alexandrium_andersonii.AAC.1
MAHAWQIILCEKATSMRNLQDAGGESKHQGRGGATAVAHPHPCAPPVGHRATHERCFAEH